MESRLSQTFTFLRFPLAILVIYLHIADFRLLHYFTVDRSLLNSDFALYFFILRAVCTIANCAVPCFFLMSGYLLALSFKKFDLTIYLSKLKNRFFTLVVPFILWNLIAAGYLYATHQTQDFSLNGIFLEPVNFPLWFVRNLIGLNLIFPLLYFFAKYTKWTGVLAVLALYIFRDQIYGIPVLKFMQFYYIPVSLCFFTFGVYGGLFRISPNHISQKLRIGIYILFAILFTYYVSFPWDTPFGLESAVTILGTLSIFGIVYDAFANRESKTWAMLGTASFFIYAFHKIGPTYLAKKAFSFLPGESYYTQTIIFLVAPLLTALICLGIYFGMKKVTPRTLKLLTGGKE